MCNCSCDCRLANNSRKQEQKAATTAKRHTYPMSVRIAHTLSLLLLLLHLQRERRRRRRRRRPRDDDNRGQRQARCIGIGCISLSKNHSQPGLLGAGVGKGRGTDARSVFIHHAKHRKGNCRHAAAAAAGFSFISSSLRVVHVVPRSLGVHGSPRSLVCVCVVGWLFCFTTMSIPGTPRTATLPTKTTMRRTRVQKHGKRTGFCTLWPPCKCKCRSVQRPRVYACALHSGNCQCALLLLFLDTTTSYWPRRTGAHYGTFYRLI